MKIVEWLRGSQAILFEASVIPALVGTATAVHTGAPFNAGYLFLILVSLVGIQAGANLLKGYYESRGQATSPSSPGSWVAFDSGAAIGLAKDPKQVLRIGRTAFVIGIVAGLVLVAITANLVLLAFGLAGAALAWSYSSPPLKLSYRGVGEISTFLAFGPIMTVGATVAFGSRDLEQSLPASIVIGFLAAAISFARYFPNRSEDLAKGKRTPVAVLGREMARWVFFGFFIAAMIVLDAWIVSGAVHAAYPLIPLVVFGAAIIIMFPKETAPSLAYERTIALTIAAHVAVGLGLVAQFLL